MEKMNTERGVYNQKAERKKERKTDRQTGRKKRKQHDLFCQKALQEAVGRLAVCPKTVS